MMKLWIEDRDPSLMKCGGLMPHRRLFVDFSRW